MKKLILSTGMFFSLSCNQGVWISENIYRPKKPKFKILDESFKSNGLIDNRCVYISKKKFENYDGNRIIGYMGFYGDGKMIIDNSTESEMLITNK